LFLLTTIKTTRWFTSAQHVQKNKLSYGPTQPTKFGFDNIGKRNAAKTIVASLLIYVCEKNGNKRRMIRNTFYLVCLAYKTGKMRSLF
jgi:hypothetical protein